MTNKKECWRTAFVFSGSYLKSKTILNRLNGNLSDFDLISRQTNEQLRAQLVQIYEMCCLYQKSRHDLAPDADILQYLSQLHKLRDFLSRINGFILEIPDIASPMMITDNSLILDRDLLRRDNSTGAFKYGLRLREFRTAQAVIEFVKNMKPHGARQGFPVFENPNDSLLEFKHMLLKERLRLALQFLGKRIKQTSKPHQSYFMARQCLNFLAMVPLQHNIRSLRHIIDQCLIERSFWNLQSSEFMQGLPDCELRLNVESPILDMHLAPEPYFASPRVLWEFIRTANKNAQSNWFAQGDELILLEV
jgi:hypothetical protein